MEKLNKVQLIKIFSDTKLNNPENSLDEILHKAFNEVKENDTDSFDKFRTLILEANGIDEYTYYTKKVRPEIKKYVEEKPENMFLEDETYKAFLKDMRALLKNEVEFKERYCTTNHIKSRNNKLRDELGETSYRYNR